MKKSIFIVLIILIVSLIVTIGVNDKNDTINIAVFGDFSSSQATESVDSFRAMELAVEELLKLDRPYNLIRFDISNNSTLENLKRDIDDHDIQLVAGPSTSSQFLIVKEMFLELDIPVFLLSVSTDTIYETDDNLFRLTDTLEVLVDSMLKASIDVLKFDDVVIYYTIQNSNFSKPLALNIAEGLKELSNVRVVEVGDLNDTEIQTMLQKSLGNNDSIIIAGPSQAGIIAQLISQDKDMRILFPSWAKDNRTIEYTESLENEMYFISTPQPLLINKYDEHVTILAEKKNINVNSATYFGYEVIYFIDHVYSEIGSFKLNDVKEYIHEIEYYKGNFDEFYFNSYGDGGRGYDLTRINDNHFELVKSLID